MNHQEVASLVQAIGRMWPTVPYRTDVDAQFIRLWSLILSDASLAEAEAAVVVMARGGKAFPPNPGEIAAGIDTLRADAAGASIPTADEAWAEAVQAVRRRGWQNPPRADDWSHPAVVDAVRAISWDGLCHGDEMITRAHFLRMYPTIAERHARRRVTDTALTSLGAALDLFSRPTLGAAPPALAEPDPR